MLGKTLIIGDSYSTFEGAIPEGYHFWYDKNQRDETDVNKIEQTWWYNLFDGKNNILLLNESFSGTTICNSVRPNHTIDLSFVNRFNKLVKEGFFEKNDVDTVIIFGGTNDSWINSPVGEIQFDNFTEDDLLKALPACGYLASKVLESAPNAHICWLINTDLKKEIVDGIIKTAEHFKEDYIKFEYIDKMSSHPSIKGMAQISDEIKKHFSI